MYTPRTSRNRTCKTHILTLLVESYGFFNYQLIMSKLSTNVHYSKKEVWLSDILTFTYQFSKKYYENLEGYCPLILVNKCQISYKIQFFTNNFQTTGFWEKYKEQKNLSRTFCICRKNCVSKTIFFEWVTSLWM